MPAATHRRCLYRRDVVLWCLLCLDCRCNRAPKKAPTLTHGDFHRLTRPHHLLSPSPFSTGFMTRGAGRTGGQHSRLPRGYVVQTERTVNTNRHSVLFLLPQQRAVGSG